MSGRIRAVREKQWKSICVVKYHLYTMYDLFFVTPFSSLFFNFFTACLLDIFLPLSPFYFKSAKCREKKIFKLRENHFLFTFYFSEKCMGYVHE